MKKFITYILKFKSHEREDLTMNRIFIAPLFAIMMIAGLVSGSIAGHNYHGYSMKMSEMSEIDGDSDGKITFEEFSAPTTEKLKSGFKMLDTNSDEVISKEEWDEFLRVHGFDKESKG